MAVNWWIAAVSDDDEDTESCLYDLAALREVAHVCVDLPGGVLASREDDGCYSFVVVAHHSGPSTRDGVIIDGEKMEMVFHGYGYPGLRELRHTYWGHGGGEAGYLFFPSAALITAALARLGERFDLS